ncbi:MAG: hypothetical protein FWC00_02265 [Firmicutes bacterium]|nr:hypothetical protein [Bacillota bacterium]
MNRFKKFACVLCATLFASVALFGCALFSQDVGYYQNRPVARVGTGVNARYIRMRDLVHGFNAFGHQFMQQGMTMAEAYDRTLEQLIDREFAYMLSRDMFGEPTERERNRARWIAHDFIERSMRQFENEVREQMGIVAEEIPGEPDPTVEPGVVFQPFDKYIYRPAGAGAFVLATERFRPEQDNQFSFAHDPEHTQFFAHIRTPRGDNPQERTVTDRAFARLVRILRNNERGLTFRGRYTQDNWVIIREIERVYERALMDIVVLRLQTAFELGVTNGNDFNAINDLRYNNFEAFTAVMQGNCIHHQSGENCDGSHISCVVSTQDYVDRLVRDATTMFREQIWNAKRLYDMGISTRESMRQALLGGLGNVHWVPRDIADEFFTVSHILLSFSDEDNARLRQINADFSANADTTTRDNAIEGVRNGLLVQPINTETGMPDGPMMSAHDVMAEVNRLINIPGKSLQARQNTFRDLIYRFGSDPGMQNPEFEYVIGIDRRTDQSEFSNEQDTMSQMVPEFTAASRELFNREGDSRGQVSDLVWTDFGVHIVMYTRNISDFIFTNDRIFLNNAANLEHYLHSTRTSYGNMTFFDAIIQRITRNAYETWERNAVARMREEHQVTIWRSRFSHLS